MNSFAIVLVFAGVAFATPNHLKHVSVEKNVVVGSGGNLGASASWGPFSAGAGLSDSGATAVANAPGAGAGAGWGGASSSASASASAGSGITGGHVGGGPTIFDQIFNIPISVLKSVNGHLNNKEVVPGAHAAHKRLRKCRRRGICDEAAVTVTATHGAGAGAGAGASAGAQAGADAGFAGASASAHARTEKDAYGPTGAGAQTVTVRKNYDNIFAIPISALTSVNQLLNGKK